MVQLNGKYQVIESQNFDQLLIAGGVPEDKAKIANDINTVLEVTVSGKKVTFQRDQTLGNKSTELLIDGETEESLPLDGGTVKNAAKLNGNILTVTSTKLDGSPVGTRTYTFSDGGLEVVYNFSENRNAKRVYKRL